MYLWLDKIKCKNSCLKAETSLDKSNQFRKKKKAKKKQEKVDQQKIKAIAKKQQRDRGENSF